jgi:hypothetical protein
MQNACMTPEQFIALWQNNPLSERAGAQGHFDDLCELLGVDKPRDPDNYCFERGAGKASGPVTVGRMSGSAAISAGRTSGRAATCAPR